MQRRELLRTLGGTAAAASIFQDIDSKEQDLPAEVNGIRLEPAEFTEQTDRYSPTVVFIKMHASSSGRWRQLPVAFLG
jgi:hypothetical protein